MKNAKEKALPAAKQAAAASASQLTGADLDDAALIARLDELGASWSAAPSKLRALLLDHGVIGVSEKRLRAIKAAQAIAVRNRCGQHYHNGSAEGAPVSAVEKVMCVPELVSKILAKLTPEPANDLAETVEEQVRERVRAVLFPNKPRTGDEMYKSALKRRTAVGCRIHACHHYAKVCREWWSICSDTARPLLAEKAALHGEVERATEQIVRERRLEQSRAQAQTNQRTAQHLEMVSALMAQGNHEAAAAIMRGAGLMENPHAGSDSDSGADGYDSDGYPNGPIFRR